MYCKKNLHAHRLSLLKHTCTMKHQRAALLHEAEEKKKALAQKLNGEEELEVEISELDVCIIASGNIHTEVDDEGVEYVVERLETDDELDETHIKGDVDDVDEDEEDGMHMQMSMDDEDVKHTMKKIKIERVDMAEDPLADAIDHMQSEYLEEPENQDGNVEMEMVVETEEHSSSEIQAVTILSEDEDSSKESQKESLENGKTIRRTDGKIDRKSSKLMHDEKHQVDTDILVSLPILGASYQMNSPVASPSNTIGVLQPVNTLPIAPAPHKTLTLTSDGKTLTLSGGSFQPGTQYVLSKLKNKLPTLVLADRKPAIAANQAGDASKSVSLTKSISINKEQAAVAGTSYQSPKKHMLVKSLKSSTSKKPQISTHVVDTSKGLPVGGLQVSLYKLMEGRWTFLNESNTSPNGRCVDLVDSIRASFTAGRYKIHFDVDKYFTLRRIATMYPFIEVVFDVKDPAGHYHIPLLLSPFGYSTYRGSEK